jgi:hypothetical protein
LCISALFSPNAAKAARHQKCPEIRRNRLKFPRYRLCQNTLSSPIFIDFNDNTKRYYSQAIFLEFEIQNKKRKWKMKIRI